jgi:hypothetical protein
LVVKTDHQNRRIDPGASSVESVGGYRLPQESGHDEREPEPVAPPRPDPVVPARLEGRPAPWLEAYELVYEAQDHGHEATEDQARSRRVHRWFAYCSGRSLIRRTCGWLMRAGQDEGARAARARMTDRGCR